LAELPLAVLLAGRAEAINKSMNRKEAAR